MPIARINIAEGKLEAQLTLRDCPAPFSYQARELANTATTQKMQVFDGT